MPRKPNPNRSQLRDKRFTLLLSERESQQLTALAAQFAEGNESRFIRLLIQQAVNGMIAVPANKPVQ